MEIIISELQNGQTVLQILRTNLQPSKKLLARLKFGDHRLLLNGIPVRVTKTVRTGDVLSLDLADHAENPLLEWEAPLDIRYEDEQVVIINKPAGMPVHPSPGHHDHHTLANALVAHYGSSFVFRPVGRLDIHTSGCMLIAKSKYTAEVLNRKRKHGEVQKYYLALTTGVPAVEHGVLSTVLQQTENGLSMRKATPDDANGQLAKTAYRVLYHTECHALILAQTLTGRMHQIRAQFALSGFPLLGDETYGGEMRLSRQALHAYALCFDGMTVAAPLPDDIGKVLTDVLHLTATETETMLHEAISYQQSNQEAF